MKWIALTLVAFLPAAVFGQKQQIQELQRDMSALQDEVRKLQQSQTEKFAQLKLLIEQALEAAGRSSASMAVLQSSLTDRMGEQAKSMAVPVAGVGAKMDQMADEFRGVREAVADLSSRMGKMDAKLADINNAVTTLRNPIAPPAPAGGTGAPAGAAGPPAGMSAEQTYQNAYRDMQGGQMDLATQEFSDYLKYFGNTDYAPNAQFYIGDILLRKGDTEGAIKAFDAVLERYSENNKSADSRFMKGRALIQAGKPTAAAQEFRELIKRYPDTDVAAKAKSQLKGLGYAAPAAAPTKSKRKR